MGVKAILQEQRNNYLAAFDSFSKSATGSDLSWLTKLRQDACARFAETGFPSTSDEDWRFTNVSQIAKADFQLAPKRPFPALRDQLKSYRIADAACRIVFVNGYFAPELSFISNLPESVIVASLAQQIAQNPQRIEPHLGKYLNTERDPFCALNTVFVEDGAFIHVRSGTVLEAPIYLLFVSAGEQAPLMSHPRNLIIAENQTELSVVEEFVSLGSTRIFCNAATELVAGEGAVVSHYRLEQENPETFQIS